MPGITTDSDKLWMRTLKEKKVKFRIRFSVVSGSGAHHSLALSLWASRFSWLLCNFLSVKEQ